MNSASTPSRRQVMQRSAALAATAAVVSQLRVPSVHAAGSDTLKVGLVGCGGRGTGAATQALAADKGTILTAVGDAFEDRAKGCLNSLKPLGDKIQVSADRCFWGLDAYKKVLESGIDVIVLATPPGFRPQHLQAAVDAGKHIFCEKPMATDAPGYRSLQKTIQQAKEKNLALVAGFCYRYNGGEREFFKRVAEGAIGKVQAAYCTYNTGFLWSHPRRAEWSDVEWQMRNWLYFTWLSGDHLVEQAVHSVDKMAWGFQDVMPVRCVAHGGRQVRTDPAFGNIYDHFAVVYEWADGARGFLFCRQQAGCANDNSDLFIGDKGRGRIVAFRSQEIEGANAWKYAGPNTNMYQVEHDELFKSIRDGKPINDGPRMINSTMMAIMGRMAAYTGQSITWDQAIASKESLVPENLAFGALPTPPVAMPGQTKFI